MIPLGPVVARSRMKAARADVWTFLADPARRAAWWAELKLEPYVGGEIVEAWSEGEGDEQVSRDARGKVDVWVDGHAIGFTWREAGDERDTAVLVTLRAQGVDTGVTVTETGFDALPAAAERAAASQEGWTVLLRDLATAVESAVADGTIPAMTGVEAGDTGDARDAAAEPQEDAADPDGDAQDREAPADAALVAAPVIVDGEVEGDGDEAAANAGGADGEGSGEADATLEIDAEPEVGDHLELDTGSVDVVEAGAGPAEGAGTAEGVDAGSTDAGSTDAGDDLDRAAADASARPAEEGAAEDAEPGEDESASEDEAAGDGEAEDGDPEEPDFDSLIRGD